jgi:polyferredoxin
VQVCPTGIDIRKGLQYECIGCAACIDVCDGVMDKMSYPRGLIRYDTENGLAQHLSRGQEWRRLLRPRVLVYSTILLLLLAALGTGLALRKPMRVDVVRDRASLAQVVDDGSVENLYRLHVMNATEAPQRYRIAVQGLPGITLQGTDAVEVAPAEARWVTVAARVSPATAAARGTGVHPIEFVVEQLPRTAGDTAVHTGAESTFIVPR